MKESPTPIRRRKYTRYVHQFTTPDGQIRFAVGEWDERRKQFFRPYDATERKLTRRTGEFTSWLWELQTFDDRRKALRRARYLFGEQ